VYSISIAWMSKLNKLHITMLYVSKCSGYFHMTKIS
jgi:hypothetical protein